MADIILNLQNVMGVPITLTVDENQKLPVAHFVDSTGEKKAGDLEAGDCVYHGRAAFTVTA
ncbi:hypothetical protein LCGC14_0273580 [marine sediment metagenome]|uniref:Uncharacterized protein n=2 Tax=root TaxID=1 RepID=A0A9C9TJT8_9HYPH|nr:hypothetical protein [Aurantimonas coralicida]